MFDTYYNDGNTLIMSNPFSPVKTWYPIDGKTYILVDRGVMENEALRLIEEIEIINNPTTT